MVILGATSNISVEVMPIGGLVRGGYGASLVQFSAGGGLRVEDGGVGDEVAKPRETDSLTSTALL